MSLGSLIRGGRTAEVFSWGESKVIKLFQPGDFAQWATREADNVRYAHEAGLTVPRLTGLAQVDGRSGLVFERIAGPTMLEILGLRPWSIASLGRTFAELHAAIHSVCGTFSKTG